MQEIILIGAAASLGGMIVGGLSGAWLADRILRRHYQDVRGEITRLRRIAEEKLSTDDPNLDSLLDNLHTAVNTAYSAIQAMENQAKITKIKSDAGREVVTSSRQIMRMIDERTGVKPEAEIIAPKKSTPKLSDAPIAAKRPTTLTKRP
ncbi:hypothetical protein [Hyphococcus sp.]|uniref:hypothetical protein n=1 Tax=Hyphococcus sp. TaxID=2038636 RepID=UPI0020830CD2|nr:MAG: hypothetical protein DHS20C04_10310 [Marinicaulis sp.]